VLNHSKTAFDVAACRAYLQARQKQAHKRREQRRQVALQALRTAAQSILPRFPHIRRAYLFGSVLRPGALRSTSDIDVAIEGRLEAEEYFALWRQLEQAVVSWPVDLVELDQEVPFAARVREQGEVIYERTDSDPQSGHCS